MITEGLEGHRAGWWPSKSFSLNFCNFKEWLRADFKHHLLLTGHPAQSPATCMWPNMVLTTPLLAWGTWDSTAPGGPVPEPLICGASPVPQVQLAGLFPRTRSALYMDSLVSLPSYYWKLVCVWFLIWLWPPRARVLVLSLVGHQGWGNWF